MKSLYNNYDINDAEMFDAYKEFCEANEIELTSISEDSVDFYNWQGEQLAMEWDDFLTNLRHDDDNNVDCVVTGSVGRWNGTFDIEAKHFSTLEDAILTCVKSCEYIIICEIDGVIDIEAMHHDATNNFKIHKLNKKGYDAHCEDEELNNEEYYDKFNIEW